MFAITKAGKARKEYVRHVRGIMTDVFNLSFLDVYRQNKVWEEWLGLKEECESSDLCKLLNSDVNDAFKARAIAILLVPRIKLSPFAWAGDKRSSSINYLSRTTLVLSKLSPKLQTFTVALLEVNTGVALMPDADENLRETLYVYNEYIIQSLSLLPEDDSRAGRLFDRYQINDPVAWYNIVEDESGYKPFGDIMISSVPEKWKCLADKKMQEIIHAEEKGLAQPREKWERALPKYMDSINVCSFRSSFIYGLDLLASQVEFVLDLNTTTRLNFNIYTLLAMPDGVARKELRHRMARHAMRIKDSGFAYGFRDGETLMNTSKILEEFGNEDAELGNWLREILTNEKVREQNKSSSVSKEQARIGAIVAKMK